MHIFANASVPDRCLPCVGMQISLNGGLHGFHDAQAHLGRGLDGVMAGRWLLRSPLDVLRVDSWLGGGDTGGAIPVEDAGRALEAYVRAAMREARAGEASLGEAVRPLALVSLSLEQQLKVAQLGTGDGDDGASAASATAAHLFAISAPLLAMHRGADTAGLLDAAGSPRFRAYNKALARVCGRKVLQKLRRNQAEVVRPAAGAAELRLAA